MWFQTRKIYFSIIQKFGYKQVFQPFCKESFGKLYDLLPSSAEITSNDAWKNAFTNIMLDKYISNGSLEYSATIIMKACAKQNNLLQAKSFINYLENEGTELNIVAKSHYFALLGAHYNDEIKDEFYEVKQKLKQFETLDSIIETNLLKGIVLAGFFDEAIQYAEGSRDKKHAQNIVQHNMLLKNGFKSIEKDFRLGRAAPNTLFHVIEEADRLQDKDMRDSVLEYLKNVKHLIPQYISNKLISTPFFNAKLAIVQSGQPCPSCSERLRSSSIVTEEEMKKLSNYVDNCITIKSDIYLRTTPEEWQCFKKRLQSLKLLDFVVDGNNILYQVKKKRIKPNVFRGSFQVNDRVLVILRKHLLGYFYKNRDLFPYHTHVHPVENVTKDDNFVLFAAFHGGPNCKLVTKDFFRSETSFLKEYEDVIRRFQIQNHLAIKNSRIVPKCYQWNLTIQQSPVTNTMHIPISVVKNSIFESRIPFLCMKVK